MTAVCVNATVVRINSLTPPVAKIRRAHARRCGSLCVRTHVRVCVPRDRAQTLQIRRRDLAHHLMMDSLPLPDTLTPPPNDFCFVVLIPRRNCFPVVIISCAVGRPSARAGTGLGGWMAGRLGGAKGI